MRIIIIFLIIAVSFALTLYLYCHFENARFNITEYTIYSNKIAKDVTFAVLADLHNYRYGEDNCRLMLALAKIKPDFVVSAGDMIEAGEHAKGTKETIEFLKVVSDKYPFFYGIGNHETTLLNKNSNRYKDAKKDFFEALDTFGIELKNNESCDYKEYNVRLSSLNIEKRYYKKFVLPDLPKDYIENSLGKADTNQFNILVGHDPNRIEEYAAWGADLVLSGHVHGGMIALPNGRGLVSTLFTLFPKYYAGLYQMGSTIMVVSRGIGNHSIHVRINNRAEVLKINIKKED